MTLRRSLVIAFILVVAAARPAVAQQRATVCNGGTVPVVAFSAYDMGLLASPDDAIVICSAAPDIFNGRLGRGYATALVGKTVEVQGLVGGALCDPRAKATIQVTMSNQLRIR